MAAKNVFFMAHQKMLFKLDEKNPEGETYLAKVGPNTAPAWVAQTDLFKLALGGLKPLVVKSQESKSAPSDKALEKTKKENAKLRKRIEELEREAEAKIEANVDTPPAGEPEKETPAK